MAQSESTFSGGVFISYRRKVAGGYGGNLYQSLSREFGSERVFFDERSIEPGTEFPDEIAMALGCAQVILIVIAPGWTESIHERVTFPEVDWVLREVEYALVRKSRSATEAADRAAVYVVLVGGAVMPGESQLPEKVRGLHKITAHPLGGNVLDRRNGDYLNLVSDIAAHMPISWAAVDLDKLAEEVCVEILGRLDQWLDVPDLKRLSEKWARSFSPCTECQPWMAINEWIGVLTRLNDPAALRRHRMDADRIESLRLDGLQIVAELFRLGACRIGSRPGVLGDHYRPAQLQSLAMQMFALAYAQADARRAVIKFTPGDKLMGGHIPIERVLDLGTVSSGISDDLGADIAEQLWHVVPQFTDETVPFPRKLERADQIMRLASAIRGLNIDGNGAKVTIAVKGICSETSGAHHLRRWAKRMDLDVDVAVRTGKSGADIVREESDLVDAVSRCLVQLQRMGRHDNKTR